MQTVKRGQVWTRKGQHAYDPLTLTVATVRSNAVVCTHSAGRLTLQRGYLQRNYKLTKDVPAPRVPAAPAPDLFTMLDEDGAFDNRLTTPNWREAIGAVPHNPAAPSSEEAVRRGREEPNDATALGMQALAETAARNEARIQQLVPIAREIASTKGYVTAYLLRTAAMERGVLPPIPPGKAKTPKDLSFLGAVFKRAGLVNTGTSVRSTLRVTHGIRNTVWKLPEDK